MIIALIFLLHIVFLLTILVKTTKSESAGSALLNIIFVVIIFSVGWTLISFVINLFVKPIGLGKYFDRNTISLVILAIAEIIFYWNYFKKNSAIADDKEIQ